MTSDELEFTVRHLWKEMNENPLLNTHDCMHYQYCLIAYLYFATGGQRQQVIAQMTTDMLYWAKDQNGDSICNLTNQKEKTQRKAKLILAPDSAAFLLRWLKDEGS